MECTKVQDQLSAYIEEGLPASAAEAVRRHLMQCAVCRSAADDLRALTAMLRALPVEPAPADLARRVRVELEAAPWWQGAWDRVVEAWRISVPVGALATVAVALLVVRVSHVTEPQVTAPRTAGSASVSEMESDALKAMGRQRSATPAPANRRLQVADSSDRKDLAQSDARDEVGPIAEEKAKEVSLSKVLPAAVATPPAAGRLQQAEGFEQKFEQKKGRVAKNAREMIDLPTAPQFSQAAGDASYRLQVTLRDLAAGHAAIAQFVSVYPTRGFEQPGPTTYCMVLTTEGLAALHQHLLRLGPVVTLEASNRLPGDFPPSLAWAPSPVRRQDDPTPVRLHWVVLELVAAPTP